MTLFQLGKCIEAYTEKNKEEYKANICYSFYTAYFNTKAKTKEGLKNKDLNDILDSIDKPKPKNMTDEAMAKMARLLNKMYGGEEICQQVISEEI